MGGDGKGKGKGTPKAPPPPRPEGGYPKAKAQDPNDGPTGEGKRVQVAAGMHAGKTATVLKATGEGKEMKWRVAIDDGPSTWVDLVKPLDGELAAPKAGSPPAKASADPLGEGQTVEVVGGPHAGKLGLVMKRTGDGAESRWRVMLHGGGPSTWVDKVKVQGSDGGAATPAEANSAPAQVTAAAPADVPSPAAGTEAAPEDAAKYMEADHLGDKFVSSFHVGRISCMAMFPDGEHVFVHSAGEAMNDGYDLNGMRTQRDTMNDVFDLRNGMRVGSPNKFRFLRITCAAVSPLGDSILVGTKPRRPVEVWSVAAGARIQEVVCRIEEQFFGAASVAYLPNGAHALVGLQDASLKLFKVDTGEVVEAFQPGDEDRSVTSLAVFSDGLRLLAARGHDVELFEWGSGRMERPRPAKVLRGCQDTITAVAVLADNSCALASSEDGTVKVWDASSGQLTRTIRDNWIGYAAVNCVIGLKATDVAVTANRGGKTILWDVPSGQVVSTLEQADGHGVDWVVASPAGDFVLLCSNSMARLWRPDVSGKKAPLQVEAGQQEDGTLVLSCMDLGGNEVGVLTEVDPEDKFNELVVRIRKEVEPPQGFRWEVIIDGEFPDTTKSLNELFGL